MDATARRILASALEARRLGEESVLIDVAGLAVTVPALPDSEIVHGQMRLLDAANAQHPHSSN